MSLETSAQKRNIVYVIVVGGVLVFIAFMLGIPGEVRTYFPIKGEIVSIENVTAGGRDAKEALVKLDSGRVVRAEIPPACVVFVGQIARLGEVHTRSGANYMVFGSEEKQ